MTFTLLEVVATIAMMAVVQAQSRSCDSRGG